MNVHCLIPFKVDTIYVVSEILDCPSTGISLVWIRSILLENEYKSFVFNIANMIEPHYMNNQ
jgi:hypothetical protein